MKFCSSWQSMVKIIMFGEVTNQAIRCSIYYNFLLFSPPPILSISLLLLLLLLFSLFLCFSFPLLINYVCHLQLTECCTAALSALNCCSLSLFPISLFASQSFPFTPPLFLTLNLSFLTLSLYAHTQTQLNPHLPPNHTPFLSLSVGPALLSQSSLQLNSTPEASLQYSASYHSNQTLALSDSISAATPQRSGQVGGAVHSYNQVGNTAHHTHKIMRMQVSVLWKLVEQADGERILITEIRGVWLWR